MHTVATAHAWRVAAIFLSEVERESKERRAEFGVRRPTGILIQTLLSAHDGGMGDGYCRRRRSSSLSSEQSEVWLREIFSLTMRWSIAKEERNTSIL